MSRDDSPADVQLARSFVAVVAGLAFAGCLGCRGAEFAAARDLPPEFRTVAMTFAVGIAALRMDD